MQRFGKSVVEARGTATEDIEGWSDGKGRRFLP